MINLENVIVRVLCDFALMQHVPVYVTGELLLVAGCGGQTARMPGPLGSFGINKTQYQDNLNCDWRIWVEAAKVSNVY